jgi:hypothetical protein
VIVDKTVQIGDLFRTAQTVRSMSIVTIGIASSGRVVLIPLRVILRRIKFDGDNFRIEARA